MKQNREKRALFKLDQNEFSNVKNVIAVVSGKGGVGKSMVTSLLASEMAKKGFKIAILDADITGPSIPKAFGLSQRLQITDRGTEPSVSRTGVKVVSTNLLIDQETSAVVWRAPIITGAIRQFWQDISWGDVDYMFVDLPPGTSDSQLTIFQSIPLMGIIVVTSPQQLVSMIVEKAMDMANKIQIPVLGVIENFSYFKAEDTGNIYKIFGDSNISQIIKKHHIDLLANIPIIPNIAKKIDEGKVEDLDLNLFEKVIEKILKFEKYEGE